MITGHSWQGRRSGFAELRNHFHPGNLNAVADVHWQHTDPTRQRGPRWRVGLVWHNGPNHHADSLRLPCLLDRPGRRR